MFRERIVETPFTSEDADYFFTNIKSVGNTYAGDKSFLATARALLGQRMPEGEELSLCYRNYQLSKSDADRFDDDRVFTSAIGTLPATQNTLTVVEVVDPETLDRVITVVRMHFTEKFPEWKSEDKVEALFRKSFPALCFVNKTSKAAILFVDRLALRKWHYIQVCLFRCLPWYFEGEKQITDAEKKFILTLREDNPTSYLNALHEMAAIYDFEKSRIRRLLSGFETTYERRRFDSIKNEISRYQRQLEDYNNSIAAILGEIRERNISLMGLEAALNQHDGQSELMDYFLADNKLGIESAVDGELRFTVKGFFENFDEDEAEAVICNASGQVACEPSGARIKYRDMKKLLLSVFVDRKIKLRVCAAYTFYIGDRIQVSGQSGKRYPAEFSSYLPNPHIQGYACMGTYSKIVNEMLRAGDYVGAIVQCEVSCNSLNWGDYTVISNFVENIYKTTNTCFELPDGRCVDQVAAVEWLNEQEG